MSRRLVLIAILVVDALIIGIPIVIAVAGGNAPNEYLGEDGIPTYLSFAQLLAAATLTTLVFVLRRRAPGEGGQTGTQFLWLAMALGFLYLAFDELLMVSQSIGDLINSAFEIERPAIAERTGDVVVALYGVIGLIVLVVCRRELLRYRTAISLLVAGIVLMVCTVVLDILSNRADLLGGLVSEPGTVENARCWLCAVKDLTTILAEGFLIGFAYYVLDMVRKTSPVADG
jgi:hypothetical protein